MSIIDTLVSEARAVRESNIRELPAIAARRVDRFLPDGAELRACATSIEVIPNLEGCDNCTIGEVVYTLAFSVAIVVRVDDQEDAPTDVRIRVRRAGEADDHLSAAACSRAQIARALYRGSIERCGDK